MVLRLPRPDLPTTDTVVLLSLYFVENDGVRRYVRHHWLAVPTTGSVSDEEPIVLR